MQFTCEKDKYGGEFIRVSLRTAISEAEIKLNELIGDVSSMIVSRRTSPFWLKTVYCNNISDIPEETHFIAVKHLDGTYSVYFSLACEKVRTVFFGKNNNLYISAITGDSNVKYDDFYIFYKLRGNDFYDLVAKAAKSIVEKFKVSELRVNKKKPEFMKYFGWCTWDSFYRDVSKDKIEKGLQNFKDGGFVPKFLLIDDGWQVISNPEATGTDAFSCMLSDIKPNDKFDSDFTNTIKLVKNKYGVETVFVWHALMGYWSGIDVNSDSMKKYQPEVMHSIHPNGIKNANPEIWESEQRDFGMVNPDLVFEFYNDYHKLLKSQGIDGVKVDSQGTLDSVTEGLGGRCVVSEKIHTALEKSTQKNFDGEMINCMSCSNDILYHIKNSNMMRTSNDFFPEQPETHIVHIYDNAINSIWISEFTYCDWDMFQTNHEYGEYHAAARAISGGPIYVSDRIDEHNFELIKYLTDDNGEILCPEEIARPTLDCLFTNIIAEKLPFKIFNKNKYNGVIGVFSGDDNESADAKTIRVSPSDIYGFSEGQYAVYSRKTGKSLLLNHDESFDVSVKAKEYDIITIAKVTDDFAVLGVVEKFNMGGAVIDISKDSVTVKCNGALLLYDTNKGFYTKEVKSYTMDKD